MKASLTPIEEVISYLLDLNSVQLTTEILPIEQALGRVLAKNIRSNIDVPSFDNSAVDGYAARAADFLQGPLPETLRVAAGDVGNQTLAPGTCARIFTGAVVPSGADTVIMQEHTTKDHRHVLADPAKVQQGANIRLAGQDLIKGQDVLLTGTRLNPQTIGLLASIGEQRVTVYKKLKVATFSTGDELVEPGRALKHGQIYNSNQYTITNILKLLGAEVLNLGNVPDHLESTLDVLERAANESDLIITSGGVSVGEEDYVRQCIEKLGELNLWKVAIKPGKPFAFGRVSDTPFVGLPGNPSAVLVTLLILVKPFIKKLQGELANRQKFELLPCDFSYTANQLREQFLFVRRENNSNKAVLKLHENQSSGVLSTSVWASGLVRVPVGKPVESGALLPYYDFDLLLT